ncbi:12701_t:CDS:2, partial [Acaulospora colombiana]
MTEGQWTSVTNSRNGKTRSYLGSKTREKSRGQGKVNHNKRGNISEVNKRPSQQQSTHSSSRLPNHGPNHNTYNFPPNFDVANSFPPYSDISNSDGSSRAVSPDTTLLTALPSYHIELMIECPFANCLDQDKSEVTINDSTYLVEHLKDKHKIHFKDLHHVYLILEKYLKYWANQITQEAIMEKLNTEISEDEIIYVIDPEKLPQDKYIREQFHREKLEPGKNWETYENERYESDEDHNRDDSWDDWNEEEPQSTLCLFCENISLNPNEALNHMRSAHGFDLLEIKKAMVQADDPLLRGFEDDDSSIEDDNDSPLHFPNNTVVIPEKAPEELGDQMKQMLTLNQSEFGLN